MKLADCHPNRKMQARGMCKTCYDKWLKSVNPNYKLAQISNTTKWTKANPEKYKIIQERRKEKLAVDPVAQRNRKNSILKNTYGITIQDLDTMLKQQNYSCALCFRKQGKYKLHVDHDHSTGQVRGLLCHQCNWYLGTVDADPTILDRITNYRRAANE